MISNDCDISFCRPAPNAEIYAPLKDYQPNHHDNRRDRDRQRLEHNLNAEPGNGHRRSLRRGLILGIVLASFFYLIVSCFYWLDLDKGKFDRTGLKLNHGERQ